MRPGAAFTPRGVDTENRLDTVARMPTDKRANRRGSPEAVEKRRVAREFNERFAEVVAPALDGRTARRRTRLLTELAEGHGDGRPFRPLDVLLRVHELLSIGCPERLIALAHRPPRPVRASAERVALVAQLHRAHAFAPAAYRFVGFGPQVLAKAGIAVE